MAEVVEIKQENLVYAKPKLITENVMHYCPGCSHGTIHKLVAEVIDEMRMIEKEGKGAVVYLSQEGRGIGLFNKIAAYKLQDEGLDTVDANVRLGFGVDERDYGVGASIIREMGIKHMRLMTNNPLKRVGLEGYGLKIDEIVPIVIAPNKYNERYLETKQERMHHKLNLCKH